MRSRCKKIGLVWVAFAVLFFVYSGAVYAEVGVTDTSVKIGVVADTTGPIASGGKIYMNGMMTRVKHINGGGGIHGRKIVLLQESDEYNAPKAVAITRKFLYNDKAFALTFCTG